MKLYIYKVRKMESRFELFLIRIDMSVLISAEIRKKELIAIYCSEFFSVSG